MTLLSQQNLTESSFRSSSYLMRSATSQLVCEHFQDRRLLSGPIPSPVSVQKGRCEDHSLVGGLCGLSICLFPVKLGFLRWGPAVECALLYFSDEDDCELHQVWGCQNGHLIFHHIQLVSEVGGQIFHPEIKSGNVPLCDLMCRLVQHKSSVCMETAGFLYWTV